MSLSRIAIKTLCADRGKLLTAIVGVAFSIALVNIQTGLFIGLMRKAGLLVDHSQADIWVGHKMMHNADFPRDIPRRWIHRVKATPGVARVEPYVVGFSDMTLPSGGYENVVVVGVVEHAQMGIPWNLDSNHTTDAGTIYSVTLQSQTWREIPWTHALQVYQPAEMTYPDVALLFISGGSTGRQPKLEDHALGFALANLCGARVAVLPQVPNQPLLDGKVEDDLKRAGFPPLVWYDVLWELDRTADGRLQQSAVQSRVLLAQYNLCRLVDRLEREGLLARNPCPFDGRSNVLAITEKGRKLRSAMWPTYAAAIETHLGARLTPEEARQLAAILGKLLPAAKTS